MIAGAIIASQLAALDAAMKAIAEKPRPTAPFVATPARRQPKRGRPSETYQPFPSDPDTLAPTLLMGGLLFGLFD